MVSATASRGRLARAQEAKVIKRREQEAQDEVIQKYYTQQRNTDAAARNALKDDHRRQDREARERNAEVEMLESIYRNTKQRELAQLRTAEEQQLATAVLAEHAIEQRERGEIADLHSRHDILRELASKLRTAKVSREQHLQKQEKAILNEATREYEELFAEKLERDRCAAVQAEEKKQWERRLDNFKAREMLEDQMQERHEQQAAARIEFERERAMVDAVMQAIEEEDRLQGELKRQKAAETMKYIHDFIADRDRQRQKQRQAEFEEERKIQDHLQEVKRREDAQQAAQAAKREEADRIYTRLKAEKEATLAAEEEQHFLINLLRQEEAAERDRQTQAERAAHRELMKKEMISANQRQMELKAQRQAEAAAEEEHFRQSMLEKFAEDDRIEQMNAQKRRMKMLEHRREAERIVDQKRRLFEEAKRHAEAEEAARIAREERELHLVERERRRLLRDAAEVMDYLPKGALRNRDDLDYVLTLAQELKHKGRID
eukprot:jgi/Ulvmu1/152/UM001_0156.1